MHACQNLERRFQRSLVVLTSALALAGCGKGGNTDFAFTPAADRAAATAPERAAAAKLSLTSSARLEGTSAYQRALTCAASVQAMRALMANNPLLGSKEKSAIRAAEAEFARRTLTLAEQDNKSPAEARAELKRAVEGEADTDPGTTAANAVACIKALADPGAVPPAPQG